MKSKYYTYVHLNPTTNEVFYVGKGSGDRAYRKSRSNNEWKNYVESIGGTFKVLIVKNNLSSEEAEDLEAKLIIKIGANEDAGTLVNKAGIGYDPSMTVQIGNEDYKNDDLPNKYKNWGDKDIIEDLLRFPNWEMGIELEKAFTETYRNLVEELTRIEEENEDLYFDLTCFYDCLEEVISNYKHSVFNKADLVEELELIQEEIDEFREENKVLITSLVNEILHPIERELISLIEALEND